MEYPYDNPLDVMILEYHDGASGHMVCKEVTNQPYGARFVYTAYCSLQDPTTVVSLWVSDSTFPSVSQDDEEEQQADDSTIPHIPSSCIQSKNRPSGGPSTHEMMNQLRTNVQYFELVLHCHSDCAT